METKYYTLVVHHDTAEITEVPQQTKKAARREKIFWALVYALSFAAILFCIAATVYALMRI